MDVEKENALRDHIRKLLLRYSLTHLTINYVTYTRIEVSELLSGCLTVVPLDDPTSLALPIEPYEELSMRLRLNDQKPYDQLWPVEAETLQYFSDTLGKENGREPPSERRWRTDNETPYMNLYRLDTPLLTTRAIRQTPKIGESSSTPMTSFKRCDSHYLEHVAIKPVADEVIEEIVFSKRERDDLLNLRPTLDKETLEVISSLPVYVPDIQHHRQSGNDGIPSLVSAFLYNETSPLVNPQYPMSPPIFPRRLAITGMPGLGKASDIPSLGFITPVKPELEEAEDVSKAHMVVVDGWNVMLPPPDSQDSFDTPSLEAGSQSSQMELDELFALTPPSNSHTDLLTKEKMEEYLFPRSHKPGRGRNKSTGEPKQSLANFLPPLLPPSADLEHDVSNNPAPQPLPVSLSILGQPSSPAKSSMTVQSTVHPLVVENGNPSVGLGLDALITQLCAPVNGQCAEDYIMHERIVEKEALMMDVPKLKEPYLHPKTSLCPKLLTSVRSLVSVKNNKLHPSTMDTESDIAYIKKVSGVQSLNIELSWRPFNFGTSIPKTEELVDVEHYPMLNSQSDLNTNPYDETNELKKLFEVVQQPGTGSEEHFGTNFDDEPPIDWSGTFNDDWSRYDVILTRAERRRVSALQLSRLDGTEDATAVSESFDDPSGYGIQTPTRSSKRRKVLDSTLLGPSLRESELQGDTGFIEDIDRGRFSFKELCSPERDNSQPRSQDAPLWNHGGDIPDSETVQNCGLNFLDHHLDPIWTAEAAARATSLVDDHPTSASAGTLVNSRIDLLPMTQGCSSRKITPTHSRTLFPRKMVPVQSPGSVPLMPMHSSEPSSAPTVPAKPASYLSSKPHSGEPSAQAALSDFMRLRAIVTHEPVAHLPLQPEPEPELPLDVSSDSPRAMPTGLMDPNTLSLPEEWILRPTRHRYIASLDVIQKTILLKHLTSVDCNVELVERETSATNGVDLIIDLDTAVLFVPLALLPVMSEALVETVSRLSWDYSRLVIIFEAFSSSLCYRRDKNEPGTGLTPYAFSPAIVKAVRNFKRTLAIKDGMTTGNKRREVEVRYAYARNVGEAARFARMVGDMGGMASATQLESDQDWLTDDFHEDEADLAQIKGMNVSAAAMILRHVDFNTFIDMTPGNRIEMFSVMVGLQRITMFNEEIANRLTNVNVSSSSPPLSSFKPGIEHLENTSYYDNWGEDVEIMEECEDPGYCREGQELQEDAMEWQPTGLLRIPGQVG